MVAIWAQLSHFVCVGYHEECKTGHYSHKTIFSSLAKPVCSSRLNKVPGLIAHARYPNIHGNFRQPLTTPLSLSL